MKIHQDLARDDPGTPGSAFPAGRGNDLSSNATARRGEAAGSGGATVVPGWRYQGHSSTIGDLMGFNYEKWWLNGI